MEATVYIGIKLDWDYVKIPVTFSMPNYVRKDFHRIQNILMGGKEYSPHICAPIQYGQKIRYTDSLDAAEYLSYKETNFIQQVSGNLLYYAIAIDKTILPALSDISQNSPSSQKNCKACGQAPKLLSF